MHDTLRPPAPISERDQDGPDMWHFNTIDPPFRRDYSNVGLTEHDYELYRVRNNPHLYDEWHVELVDTQRADYIDRLEKRLGIELIDWDCHTCRCAVISRRDTYTVDTKCPKCKR